MAKTFFAFCCILLVLVWSMQLSPAQRQHSRRRGGATRNGMTGNRARSRDPTGRVSPRDRSSFRGRAPPRYRTSPRGSAPARNRVPARDRAHPRYRTQVQGRGRPVTGVTRMSSSFSNFLNAILGDSSDIVYNGNSFSLSIGDSTLSLGTFLSDGQESSHVVITNPGNIPTEASQAGGATETSTVASEVGSIATETIPWRGKGSFTGDLRLACKRKRCTRGLVEVYNREEHVWGTICANGWGREEAEMVCNYLKFSKGARKHTHLRRARTPQASRGLAPFYQNMTCTGNEKSIMECGGQKASSEGTCPSDRLAGVKCAGRIVDNREPIQCGSSAVRCSNREKCIQSTYLCDGMSDCPWGTDEKNCDRESCPSGSFHCGSSGVSCISQILVCDGADDCGNGKDEVGCGDYLSLFRRRNGVKLGLGLNDYNSEWKRISHYMCAKKCLEEKTFRCAVFDYNQAVRECHLATKSVASAAGLIVPATGRENWNHFALNPTSDCSGFRCGDKCLANDRVCDGFVNCLDGADEAECDSDPSQLPANFRIRVRGGLTRLEGRLEVSAGDDDYGLVCDIGWTIREASVACRMLGFRGGAFKAISGQFFPRTNLGYKISGFRCQGHETNLADCEHDSWNQPSCNMDHEAGVVCLSNFITTLIPQTVSAVTVTVATTSSTTTTTTTTPTTVPTAAQVPITSSACGSKSRHAENIRLRVVGGTVANAHEWPWQVGIWLPWQYLCGGTLIASCWVLSAAHCFADPYHVQYYTIRLGDHWTKYAEGTEQDFKMKRFVNNHQYNAQTVDNDISLIELLPKANSRCATFNTNVQPACIPNNPTQFEAKHRCYVTGWGQTSTDRKEPFASQLHEAQVPLIGKTECSRMTVYGRRLTSNMLCAGFLAGGVDTCQGDSGGPLTCLDENTNRYYIWGVVSWGHGCAKPRAPGVYTKVHNYKRWIRSVTGIEL